MSAGGEREREHDDALVIFARYPEPGRVKTRLARAIGDARAAEVYRAFLLDLAERFPPTAGERDRSYDVLWACAPGGELLAEVVGEEARIFLQRGETLDERLALAAEDVCARGYRRLAVVGSDAPHLPAEIVRDALALLETQDAVFGPAEDGGYYLAALHLQPQVAEVFRGIQMSTPYVLADTLRRTRDLGVRTVLLPALFDVDEIGELRRLAQMLETGTEFAAPQTHRALRRLGLLG